MERDDHHGRTSSLRRPEAGGGVDDGALPGVRHLAQDRAQALRPVQGDGLKALGDARDGRAGWRTGCRCGWRRRSCAKEGESRWGARKLRELLARGSARTCRCRRECPIFCVRVSRSMLREKDSEDHSEEDRRGGFGRAAEGLRTA